MKVELGEGNLLDHRGVEAVKAAVKSHTLKEKKGVSGIRPHPSGASESGLLGKMALGTEQAGGEGGRAQATGVQACSAVTVESGS